MIWRHYDVFTDVIQHRVKLTDDTPIPCKPYPLPYAMKEELRNEVDSMLQMGVVTPLSSPYTSPIVMIKKKGICKNVCVCVDFIKWNKITKVDPEPMTTAEDMLQEISVQDPFNQNILADTGCST